MKYQIREFVCGGENVFEVWQCHDVSGWWRTTYRREMLKQFSTFLAAQNYISKIAGGYYESKQDYDASGKPIFYGW